MSQFISFIKKLWASRKVKRLQIELNRAKADFETSNHCFLEGVWKQICLEEKLSAVKNECINWKEKLTMQEEMNSYLKRRIEDVLLEQKCLHKKIESLNSFSFEHIDSLTTLKSKWLKSVIRRINFENSYFTKGYFPEETFERFEKKRQTALVKFLCINAAFLSDEEIRQFKLEADYQDGFLLSAEPSTDEKAFLCRVKYTDMLYEKENSSLHLDGDDDLSSYSDTDDESEWHNA